ncbi:MAG: hypothetical protein RLZZ479_915 [Bacteroidota bacterium]|jgi:hypothetical protein
MKTENIKIAIFPIGSSLKFNKNKIKRSDGSSEYYKLFFGLARNASVSELWIMQRSDWKKLTNQEKIEIDPRGIIRDIYTEFGISTSSGRTKNEDGSLNDRSNKDIEAYKNLWEKVSHLEQPDFGIGFASQGLTMVNIPGIIPSIRDNSRMTTTLDMTLIYSAPIVHWLNMSKIPWYMVMTDPRYIKKTQKWRDMVNAPKMGIAQYNETINLVHYDTYPNPSQGQEITEDFFLKYSGIEKLNLIGEAIEPPDNERDVKFSVVAMQSAYGHQEIDYRLEALKTWILNRPGSDDYHIYGKWDERFTANYSQFKGFKTADEIDEIFKRTRYTLIIPIRPNWVTSKYAEMLRVGVVPFFHPDYDTQYSLVPKDHYIRVKTPQEMFDKIEELESNPAMRIKLVKELQVKFLKGVRKGTFLANIFNGFLEETNVNIKLSEEYNDEILREIIEEPLVQKIKELAKVKAKSLF